VWGRCMHFLPRKRRHCTVPCSPGSRYCGNHQPVGRIPCPVDPSHTINEGDAARHITRCTDATRVVRIASLPCYCRRINCGATTDADLAAITAWRTTWDAMRDAAPAIVSPRENDGLRLAPCDAGRPCDDDRHPPNNTDAVSRMLEGEGDRTFAEFASRVTAWHETHCHGQSERAVAHLAAPHLCPDPSCEASTLRSGGRHVRQVDKLVALMARSGLLQGMRRGTTVIAASDLSSKGACTTGSSGTPLDSTSSGGAPLTSPRLLLVEFGAGKGVLGCAALRAAAVGPAAESGPSCSSSVASAPPPSSSDVTSACAQLILLERGANRLKADRRGRAAATLPGAEDAGLSANCQRIRMDIADFALARHPAARGVPLRTFAALSPWDGAAGHSMPPLPGRPFERLRRRDMPEAGPSSARGLEPEQERGGGSALVGQVPPCTHASGGAATAGMASSHASPPAATPCAHAATAPTTAAATATPFAPTAAPARIVALGKHLCGAATDLTLRCIALATVSGGPQAVATAAGDPIPQPCATATPGSSAGAAAAEGAAREGTLRDNTAPAALSDGPGPAALPVPELGGVAIATCCHHACSWADYVGKRFFRDVLSATPVDFERMRMLSSWGVLLPDDGGCGGAAILLLLLRRGCH
jgi:hypothetical protein